MTAQDGLSFLLKVGDGASPEVFTTVGGFRANSLTLDRETVDTTTKTHTDKWRRRSNFGLRQASISGEGLFEDSASEETVRANFFGSDVKNWQVVVPGFGTFEGAFIINSLEYQGPQNDAVAYSIGLESAGALTFTSS